jgi:FHIPEP family protein
MDGAAKFVRVDAIAGLLITFINLVGGLIIGVGQMGVSFAQAALLLETTVDVPAGARLQLILPDGIAAQTGRPASEGEVLRRALGTLLGPAGTAESAVRSGFACQPPTTRSQLAC